MLMRKQLKISGVIAIAGLAWLAVACGKSETVRLPNANVNTTACSPGMPTDATGRICVSATTIEQMCSNYAAYNGRVEYSSSGALCHVSMDRSLDYTVKGYYKITPTSTYVSGTGGIGVSVSTLFYPLANTLLPTDRLTIRGTAEYGSDKDNGGFGPCLRDGDYDYDREGREFATGTYITDVSGQPAGLMMSNGTQSIALFGAPTQYSFSAASSSSIFFGFNASAPAKACSRIDLDITLDRCFNLAGQMVICP